MSFFVIYGVSNGTLFFGLIFLLLILKGTTNLAAESIISFIDGHLIPIGIVLGLIAILLTFFITREYMKKPNMIHHPVLFALGSFFTLAQAAVMLVIYVRAPFTNLSNGLLLPLFGIAIKVVISIVGYIINICITCFVFVNSMDNNIILLYIWPIVVVALLFLGVIG